MSEEEKKALNNLKFKIVTDIYDVEEDKDKTKIVNEYNESVGIVLNLINKLQEENENAKWYIHQMIVRLSEDIEDYIDDDREENKEIIGELRETRKQWQDVEKLLNGESKDNLYNDWRKYGEYE